MTPTSRYMQSLLSVVLAGALVAPSWANDFVHPTSYPQSSTETSTMTHPSLPSDGSTAFPLEEQASSIVELPRSMYFMTPSGEPTQVAAGSYVVETADTWLQLTPVDGERFDKILLQAQHVQLDRPMGSTQVELRTSPEQHPDLHPLVLISSTGLAYEAVGSESGVWPRWGWSSIKKAAKKVGKGIKKGAKSVGRAGKKVGSGIKRGAKSVGRAGKKVGSGIKRGARYAGRKAKAGAKATGMAALKAGKKVVGTAKKGVGAVRSAGAWTGRKLGLPIPSGPPLPMRPPRVTNKDQRCQLPRSTNQGDPCNPMREPQSFPLELAYRWAPIYYQDTARKGLADYLAAFNYDGDWSGTNNWDNIGRFPLKAYVYYSVSETDSHWYVIYSYYHPRDWATDLPTGRDNALGEHENDTEGVLTIIRKDGSKFGKLEGIVTYAHWDFYSFVPKGSPLRSGKEGVDGTLYTDRHNRHQHPMIASEAFGHGIEAWPKVGLTNKKIKWGVPVKIKLSRKMDFKGGDGIVYYPSTANDQFPDVPKNKNDRYVSYALIDIFGEHGIWNQRSNPETFVDGVRFRSDKSGGCGGSKYDIQFCETNSDTAPWGWDDFDDPVKAGIIATDPAKLTKAYFKGLGKFSTRYVRNPYSSIGSIQISAKKDNRKNMEMTPLTFNKKMKKR